MRGRCFAHMQHMPKSSGCRYHLVNNTRSLKWRFSILETVPHKWEDMWGSTQDDQWCVQNIHGTQSFFAGSSDLHLCPSQWRNELPLPCEPLLSLTVQSLLWKSSQPILLAMPVNPAALDASTYSALQSDVKGNILVKVINMCVALIPFFIMTDVTYSLQLWVLKLHQDHCRLCSLQFW